MSGILEVEALKMSVAELIAQLKPGEELTLTLNQKPVATLIGNRPVPVGNRPPPGLGKGSILSMPADFDQTPEEFKDYVG